jgi:hypothetical protein
VTNDHVLPPVCWRNLYRKREIGRDANPGFPPVHGHRRKKKPHRTGGVTDGHRPNVSRSFPTACPYR